MWAVWWAGLAVLPLAQLPATRMEDSAWILWTGWASAAGLLSLVTPRQREVKLGWLALLTAWICLRQVWLESPAVADLPWATKWGLLGTFSALVPQVLLLTWGTWAVLSYSPVPKHLPKLLLAVSLLSLVAVWLHDRGLWTRWMFAEAADRGGLWSSRTVWGAWSALTLPWLARVHPIWTLLGGWSVLASHRSTAMFVSLGWMWWRWLRPLSRAWQLACLALGLVAMAHFGEDVRAIWISVWPRLQTWPLVGWAIATHHLGIGWAESAYADTFAQTPWPMMGHPSSSLLEWVLRGGWPVAGVLAWLLWHGRRVSLADGWPLVACGLALISKTLAQGPLVMVAWALACAWWLTWSVNEEEEARLKT